MDYGKLAEITAWNVLIENRIFKFPINMFSLLYSYGICVYPFGEEISAKEIDVFTSQGIVNYQIFQAFTEATTLLSLGA